MAGVWKKGKNQGIRYREHKVRKNGVKFDRYYAVRFKVDNKDYEQGMGWASEGWNEEKCLEVLRELKKNAKEGKGPKTLKEKREEIKRKEEREVSFSSLAEEYLRHHASSE